MTARGFVSICVKLIAVYYLIQTLAGVAGASFFQMVNLSSDLGKSYVIMTVAWPAMITLGLFWLMRKSDLMASRLIQEDSSFANPQISLGDLQSVGFSCIGLGFTLSALGEIVPIIAYYYLISHFKYSGEILGNMDWVRSTIAGVVLRLGVGIFLFLYPRGLITVWRWLQDHRGLKDA
jgi:hypothetical protein